MEDVLIRFINTLRNAEVAVSTAESIDAVNTVALVGYDQRQLLHDSLSMVLAKSELDKQRFDQCFAQFYRLDPFQWNDETSDENATDQVIDNAEALDQPVNDKSNLDSETENEQDALAADDLASGLAAMDIEMSVGASANNSASEHSDSSETAGGASDSESVLEQVLQAMLESDQVALAMQLQAAAQANQLDTIQYVTQRSLYRYRILQSMQISDVEQVISALASGTDAAQQQAELLRLAVLRLREQVTDFVDQQLVLNADASSRQLREDILQNANLSRIEQRHFEAMQALVYKMSKALVARYARRRKVHRRGQLDIAKTLRHNISHDGVLFDTYWKTKKKERPEIFAICDVSGSVAAYSKFLLMFLYGLSDLLPKTRAFAFSSNLGEVSDLFKELPVEQAIERVNQQWGFGSSSYGDSLKDFSTLAMDDLRPSSTVIILGDGRNNGGNPELGILKEIYQRCNRIIWLNPESRGFWSVGDSEMPRYLSAVHYSSSCQTLRQLENIVSELLRNS